MPTESDRQIAREFQRRLTAIVPVLDLRVFGSRARGDAAPDSDLDVFEDSSVIPHLRWGRCPLPYPLRIISQTNRLSCPKGIRANPLVLNVEREGVRP